MAWLTGRQRSVWGLHHQDFWMSALWSPPGCQSYVDAMPWNLLKRCSLGCQKDAAHRHLPPYVVPLKALERDLGESACLWHCWMLCSAGAIAGCWKNCSWRHSQVLQMPRAQLARHLRSPVWGNCLPACLHPVMHKLREAPPRSTPETGGGVSLLRPLPTKFALRQLAKEKWLQGPTALL
jgi:hypothetical protein